MLCTLTLGLCLAQPPLPLDEGRRWTYQRDGLDATIVEAMGRRRVGSTDTRVLRILGEPLFWTDNGDLLLRAEKRGIVQHGYVFEGEADHSDGPVLLLPTKLEVGHTWRGGDFRATVRAREKVTVPAGTFDVYKIEYTLGDHLGTESDLRVWVAPGTGIVRFSRFQESMRGEKRPYLQPLVSELASAIDLRTHRFAPFPVLAPGDDVKVRDLVEQLGKADAAGIERLTGAILRVGRAALPLLHAASSDQKTTPANHIRIRAAMQRFPKLRLTASARQQIKIGESPGLRFRLHNDWVTPLRVLLALDASDRGRQPSYSIEVCDSDGKAVELKFAGCGNVDPLETEDFRTLRPGEDIDPFGPGTFSHMMLKWKPEAPGDYRVRLTLDTTGKVPDAWRHALNEPLSPAVLLMLKSLPRGKFVSNQVVVRVR